MGARKMNRHRSHFASILLLAILAIIILSSIAFADEKPDEYTRDPDKYYQNPSNVGQCPSCDFAYFNNPLNLGKNSDAHKKFFLTPGSILKAPQGAQAWLKKLGVEATLDMNRADKGIIFDLVGGYIRNGKTAIYPKQYPPGTLIQTLPEGGFLISKSTIKGFEIVTYDKNTGTYTMDGAKVRLPQAPAEGQKIEAIRDANGNLKEVMLPANARYDLPEGTRRILAREATTLLFDGSDPTRRTDAAIGITKETMKINNKVNAFIWDGSLQVFASKGRYFQKGISRIHRRHHRDAEERRQSDNPPERRRLNRNGVCPVETYTI